MTRQTRALLLAAVFAAGLAGGAEAQDRRTITISWWGFNGEKLEQFLLAPFRERCNCDIVFETGNNADRLNKLRARGGEGIDLIYLTDSFSEIGIKEGLFQEVDRSKLPNLEGAYDIAKAPQGNFGPAYTMGRYGIVYDSAKVDPPITSWADLWREDLRGEVSLPGITTTAGPMTVLVAAEKAGADPYQNPDAAFQALEELKPNVVKTYRTGSELVNLFSTGEVSVAGAQDFTLAQIQAAVPTARWADLKEGAFATLNTINIPKGADDVELAHEFINWHLDPQIQKTLAENGVDAPVIKSVELTSEQAALWTYGEEMVKSLRTVDYTALNAAKDAWTERWNELFAE